MEAKGKSQTKDGKMVSRLFFGSLVHEDARLYQPVEQETDRNSSHMAAMTNDANFPAPLVS